MIDNLQELERCKQDFTYWAEHYSNIKLNDTQLAYLKKLEELRKSDKQLLLLRSRTGCQPLSNTLAMHLQANWLRLCGKNVLVICANNT